MVIVISTWMNLNLKMLCNDVTTLSSLEDFFRKNCNVVLTITMILLGQLLWAKNRNSIDEEAELVWIIVKNNCWSKTERERIIGNSGNDNESSGSSHSSCSRNDGVSWSILIWIRLTKSISLYYSGPSCGRV